MFEISIAVELISEYDNRMSNTIYRKSVVFLTTAWGARHGGINSFNMDLAGALAQLLGSSLDVHCVVLDVEEGDVDEARSRGVKLLSLGASTDRFEESRAFETWHKLLQKYGELDVEWWIGHDVISGLVANQLPEVSKKGRSAVIKHMSYIDYCAYKHDVAISAQAKHSLQAGIFRKTDKRFAVGPLLRDRLIDLVNDEEVTMLIPGLTANIEAHPKKTFTVITFGRLDPENDKIKQPKLAVAAFASAIYYAQKDKDRPECLRKNPRMFLYGISEPGGAEEKNLKKLARTEAGKVVNLLPLPYTTDRSELLEEVSRASVALMLSWHEGFGLTGWEAISAEVPLITSVQSGLYEFVKEALGGAGTGCLWPVNVEGEHGNDNDPNYTKTTLEEVRSALMECASNIEEARRDAKTLKKLLLYMSCTWDNTALVFADALQLEYSESDQDAVRNVAIPATVTGCQTLHRRFDEVERYIDNLQSALRTNEQSITRLAKNNGIDSGESRKSDQVLHEKIRDKEQIIKRLKVERKQQKDILDRLSVAGDENNKASSLLSLMRRVVCYNQGEYAQYSFLAANFHKKIKETFLLDSQKSDKLADLCEHLTNFLNRNFARVSRDNFYFLKNYFQGRHTVDPRVCIKGSIVIEGAENIVEIVRDRRVNYFSEYPLKANSGFTFVKEKGTYFLCNDIPESVAHGHYVNSRIDLEAARRYVKMLEANKNKGKRAGKTSLKPEESWISCWYKPEGLEEEKGVLEPSSCYKSTLIVPMTLWNVDLDPFFRDLISTTDVGRAIFGYLCLDHVESNYFKDQDVDIGYVFSDLLFLYLITRATYTEFSKTFVSARND